MAQIAIKKSGNSITVRIPSAILKALSLNVDDPVDVEMSGGRIVLTPIKPGYEIDMPKPAASKSLAEAVRVSMGLTQQGMADYFGITLNAWQKKEMGINPLSVAEQHLCRLLINQHPDYSMLNHTAQAGTELEKVYGASLDLVEYLSGHLVLPSVAQEKLCAVQKEMRNYSGEWEAQLEASVGGALPDERELLRAKLEDALAENAELKKRLTQK